MKFNPYSNGTVVRRQKIARAVALLAVMWGGAAAMAQADGQGEGGALPVENDAVMEAERSEDVLIRSSKRPRRAAPTGVVGAASGEEILDAAPSAPRPPKRPGAGPKPLTPGKAPKGPTVFLKKGKDTSVEQRLERLERMIENPAEEDRMRRKNAPLAFQQKEFARAQKEIERAGRDAEMAVRRLRKHPGMANDFVFEHKIEIAGNARMQRKALEAQRKALEKQIEVIDQRLESLEENEESEEEEGKSDVRQEQQAVEPSLPPE